MQKFLTFTMAAVCFAGLTIGRAQAVPVVSLDVFPQFSSQQVQAGVQQAVAKMAEQMTTSQLMALGSQGGDGLSPEEVDSSASGVMMAMSDPIFVNEEVGLVALNSEDDTSKMVTTIKENLMLPVNSQAADMTSQEKRKREKAIAQIQTEVIKDAMAVGMANVRISAEQEKRQEKMEDAISESQDERNDIQARSISTLSALGELNRLLAIDIATLGVEAAIALNTARSVKKEEES